MTYSEIREKYTLQVAIEMEKKAINTKLLSLIIKTLFGWLLPWVITSYCIIKEFSLHDVRGAFLSSLVLLSSFMLYSSSKKHDRFYHYFILFFSFLVAIAACLTAI